MIGLGTLVAVLVVLVLPIQEAIDQWFAIAFVDKFVTLGHHARKKGHQLLLLERSKGYLSRLVLYRHLPLDSRFGNLDLGISDRISPTLRRSKELPLHLLPFRKAAQGHLKGGIGVQS